MELSLARPLPNNVGIPKQWFGETKEDYSIYGYAGHNGVDYSAPIGTPVLAMLPGKVLFAGKDMAANGGYGNYVKLEYRKGNLIAWTALWAPFFDISKGR